MAILNQQNNYDREQDYLCGHLKHLLKPWLCQNEEDPDWKLKRNFAYPLDGTNSIVDAGSTQSLGMAVATFVHGVDTHAPLADATHVTFTYHTFPHNTSELSSSDFPDQKTTDPTILHQYAVMDVIIVFAVIIVTALSIILISVYVGKLRKRENATAAEEESGGGAHKADSSSLTAVSVLSTVLPDSQVVDIEFTDRRRGLWQKTVHSVMLRLKGQEQHKDVYVMPDALKEQLKQVYVY